MDRDHDKGTTTSLVAGGRHKVQTIYRDGTEMVEEYDARTGELVLRRWKSTSGIGSKATGWLYEIGEATR